MMFQGNLRVLPYCFHAFLRANNDMYFVFGTIYIEKDSIILSLNCTAEVKYISTVVYRDIARVNINYESNTRRVIMPLDKYDPTHPIQVFLHTSRLYELTLPTMHNNISSSLLEILAEQPQLCDVELSTSDHARFRVHKSVVSSYSALLRDVLQIEKTASIILEHVDEETLELVVDYLYNKCKLESSPDRLPQLIKLYQFAHRYQFDTLLAECTIRLCEIASVCVPCLSPACECHSRLSRLYALAKEYNDYLLLDHVSIINFRKHLMMMLTSAEYNTNLAGIWRYSQKIGDEFACTICENYAVRVLSESNCQMVMSLAKEMKAKYVQKVAKAHFRESKRRKINCE